MATHDEILADLQATVSYINNEVTERADSTPFEEAVALVDELERVKRSVGDAIALLNGELLKQVERGSRQIGQRVYAAVPDSKTRTDHDKVRVAVITYALDAATDKETGDVSPRVAADRATEYMMDLYVSPSKVATTRGLKRMGVSPRTINHYENTGKKLRIVDLSAPKDDDEDDE